LYNFTTVFDRTGGTLCSDGSRDDRIKLQGLESFHYSIEDAKRDAVTGEMPREAPRIRPEEAAAEADQQAALSDSENEAEALTYNSEANGDSSGGDTDLSEEEGEPFVCPEGYDVVLECPVDAKGRVGQEIAHSFGPDGWFIGTVLREVTLSSVKKYNGMFACKYSDTNREQYHDLYNEDYGDRGQWVLVKRL
jgi:hypothetical protein